MKDIDFINFIEVWAPLYPKDKYPDVHHLFYKQSIEEDDLKKIYSWKNSMELSTKKSAALEKILTKIALIKELKVNFDKDYFNRHFNEISPIWQILLLHILCPDEYPVFDQHVFRAMYFMKYNEIKDLKSWKTLEFYCKEYRPFFNDIIFKTAVNRIELDQALWAFGKTLKGYGVNELIKFIEKIKD